jgi:hypothetical protein
LSTDFPEHSRSIANFPISDLLRSTARSQRARPRGSANAHTKKDAPKRLIAIDQLRRRARAKLGETPILFLSPDFDAGKVAIVATSPKQSIARATKPASG